MPGWLRLNPKNLNVGVRRNIRGADVMVFLSPYDVPEAVRGDFDKSINRFVIQFKYLDGLEEPTEPLDAESQDPHVTLMVGRHSHRLYRIEIDTEKLGAEKVSLCVHMLDQAIDRLANERKRPNNRGRYDVAKQVISQRGRELLEDLVAH